MSYEKFTFLGFHPKRTLNNFTSLLFGDILWSEVESVDTRLSQRSREINNYTPYNIRIVCFVKVVEKPHLEMGTYVDLLDSLLFITYNTSPLPY